MHTKVCVVQGSYHIRLSCNIRPSSLNLQEDLAAAEAELAGWYETMQRETNALKRIYQFEGHDLIDSPSGAGLGAEGQSPAREGLNSPQATGLVRRMSHNGEKVNKTAARQLPQVKIVLLLALQPTVLSIVCAVQDCQGNCAVYCLTQKRDHQTLAQPMPEHRSTSMSVHGSVEVQQHMLY
jgi:hypothetical protein